ncbi:MAG: hypothetical protein IJ272_11335 [Clostridia bacterium]|nr:hypothetical protein [Clostridia bacterium]
MNMDRLKMLIMNKLNSNPMFRDLIQKAQKGDKQSVENFARNICKERGIDFDKEFANFMSNFK